MSLPKKKFRELVFQLLYSHYMGKSNHADMIPIMMAELHVTKRAVLDALARVEKIVAVEAEMNSVIGEISISYQIKRIQSAELNVLRLGFFELLYDETIPPKVVIAEAVRLCLKFSTPAASHFVNAILDHIYKKRLGLGAEESHSIMPLPEAVETLLASEQLAEEASQNTPQEDLESS